MINIQNIDDNEWFKWCLVRYLHTVDHDPKKVTKAGKESSKKLDFKGIKFPVKVRDIHKIEKMSSVGISAFGYEIKKNIQSVYQKLID